MYPKQSPREVLQAVAIFVVLAVIGVGLAVGGRGMGESADQIVMATIGSALLGGGLAFFLLEVSRLDRERRQ